MPKMKTRSGAKKRFKITGAGKIRYNKAYRRHQMRAKSTKMKRQARTAGVMHEGDAAFVKRHFLPNA